MPKTTKPPRETRPFNSGALIMARRTARLHQEELAEKADCCRNTVTNAEAKGQCTPKQATRFAKALGLPVDALYLPAGTGTPWVASPATSLSPAERDVVEFMRRNPVNARFVRAFVAVADMASEAS